jgi:predicted transcriptional regulator
MPRTTKSIRLSDDAQRLLKLLAAFEDKTEGAIIEEALPLYLQMRTLSYGNQLDIARELANSTPDTAGEIVERVTTAIEEALGQGLRATPSGDGKQLLKAQLAAGQH